MDYADHKPDNPYTATEGQVIHEAETKASPLKTRKPSGEFDGRRTSTLGTRSLSLARAAIRGGVILLSAMVLASCASGGPGNASSHERSDSSEQPGQEGKLKDMDVEQLASQAPGQGQKRPRVLLASSASALSQAAGVRVSDAGEGTYLVAFRGEKPTGGYSVEITSVRLDGDRVGVQLSLKDPPPDAMVTQALTYPYAVAVVRNADLTDKEVVLRGQGGRELGWPVRKLEAGGG